MRLLFEQRFELGSRGGRCAFGLGAAAAGGKKLTEIRSFLIDYPFGGSLAALVIISGVVMLAITASVERPAA
jgi:hypothetical protein